MAETPGLPQPDPALKQFDRFIGSWTMKGGLVGADQTTITGQATYRWLPGGFFLEQHVQLDFNAKTAPSRAAGAPTPVPTRP